jgi:hypothetical protein
MRIRWARLLLGASLAAAPALVAATLLACSSDGASDDTAGAGASGATTGNGASGSGASGNGGNAVGGAGGSPDPTCARGSAEVPLAKKPIDIVLVVDNSGTMGPFIAAVQANLDASFAAPIEQSGIDYRLIVVGDHGNVDPDDSICVPAPLSSTTCMPVPEQPGLNPPIFFHYSTEIGSLNSVCTLLGSYDATVADDYGLAPMGWSEWLREDAFKVFVELSDDRVSCDAYSDGYTETSGDAMAAQLDADLLALAPVHFGDAGKRNYVWHSIVGVSANEPASAPWLPTDPVKTGTCPLGFSPGTGYQALSILTGGLRFPLCDHATYDTLFQALAEGIIESTQIDCRFPMPNAPPGETIDMASVTLEYTPGGGAPQAFQQVASSGLCAADSFYIDNDTIELCPETCALVEGDPEAEMRVLFACESS